MKEKKGLGNPKICQDCNIIFGSEICPLCALKSQNIELEDELKMLQKNYHQVVLASLKSDTNFIRTTWREW